MFYIQNNFGYQEQYEWSYNKKVGKIESNGV